MGHAIKKLEKGVVGKPKRQAKKDFTKPQDERALKL